MKKAFKWIVVIAAAIALIIVVVFSLTADLPKVAEAFFKTAQGEHFADVQKYLGSGFLAATPINELKTFLRDSQLMEYQSASWPSRSIRSGEGEIEGTITTKKGGRVPLKMYFVKENSTWKIHRINLAGAGASRHDGAPDLPSDDKLKQLVTASMHDFAQSVKAKDFTPFYQNISKMWQQQITKEKLGEIFGAFSQNNIDLTNLRDMEPVFNMKPFIDENMLTIEGAFPEPSRTTTFAFKYIYEHPQWKLIGINVHTK
jgi:hypothetical protein